MNKEELDNLIKDFVEHINSVTYEEHFNEYYNKNSHIPQITHAAVKIYDKRQEKEIIIPCHRHYDAFRILKEFGYQKNIDYKELEQGFFDSRGDFLDRRHAYRRACITGQIEDFSINDRDLYSEDLW